MRCINCGKENDQKEKFCDECGFPLEEESNREESLKSPVDSIGIRCPNADCGKMNASGTSFCTECGAELDKSVTRTQSKADARLILSDNSEISLTGDTTSIGRQNFDRVLKGEDLTYISRQHLTITRHDDEYYIEDHDSANGTKLNGVEIKEKDKHTLNDGDVIEVANATTVTFKCT